MTATSLMVRACLHAGWRMDGSGAARLKGQPHPLAPAPQQLHPGHPYLCPLAAPPPRPEEQYEGYTGNAEPTLEQIYYKAFVVISPA
jgi:hypothetical protein